MTVQWARTKLLIDVIRELFCYLIFFKGFKKKFWNERKKNFFDLNNFLVHCSEQKVFWTMIALNKDCSEQLNNFFCSTSVRKMTKKEWGDFFFEQRLFLTKIVRNNWTIFFCSISVSLKNCKKRRGIFFWLMIVQEQWNKEFVRVIVYKKSSDGNACANIVHKQCYKLANNVNPKTIPIISSKLIAYKQLRVISKQSNNLVLQ